MIFFSKGTVKYVERGKNNNVMEQENETAKNNPHVVTLASLIILHLLLCSNISPTRCTLRVSKISKETCSEPGLTMIKCWHFS